MSLVKDKSKFLAGLQAADKRARDRYKQRVVEVLFRLHHEIVDNTPVWEGSVIGNYYWSVGTPVSFFEEPIDNGPPGPTNSMPLGVEPRREVNASRSYETLMGALSSAGSNPFQLFYMNNSDPDFRGVEDGSLPPSPLVTRTPSGGMVGLGLQYIHLLLSTGQV